MLFTQVSSAYRGLNRCASLLATLLNSESSTDTGEYRPYVTYASWPQSHTLLNGVRKLANFNELSMTSTLLQPNLS